MFVKIPVYWVNDDYNEDLGVEAQYTLGEINLNVNQICGYHANDKGETMIRMTSAEVFRTPIAYADFQKEFPELVSQLELMVTNEN